MTTNREHRSRERLRRRTFFKALGLGVSATLAYRLASVADAAPGDANVRLFTFYVPHGLPIEHVGPLGQGGDFLANSTVLAPFAEFSDQVTVARGISMNDGATNHAAIRATLTGFAEGGTGDSFDAEIARGLGVDAHVIGALPYSPGSGFTTDAFLVKHGSWVRPIEDPAQAADQFFAALGSGDGGDPAEMSDLEFRQRTLALTESELETLHGELAGLNGEQDKLTLHLEAVRALKAGGSGPAIITCDERPTLPAVDALAGLDVLDPANFGKVLDGHLEAAAAAMICGSAQVITMQNMWVNADVNFGFEGGPGVPKGHHEPVSHSWDAPGRAEFATVQRWFYERLTEKMIRLLAETPDPSDDDPTRSVLDNSLIYICSEVSDGANHNSDASEVWLDGAPHPTSLPAFLIGGAGGYLNTGRAVDANRFNTDLLATIAEAMGAPIATLGGQPVSVIEELKA